MAKLSSMQGRRLRSVAVAGLIVGTTGAFFSGGHSAHAASMMPQGSDVTSQNCGSGSLQPLAINAANSGTTTFTSGTLTVSVDGATVTFTPNGTNNTLTPTQTGSFNGVAIPAGKSNCFFGDVNDDSNTASPNGSSSLSNSDLGTCQFSSYNFQVNPDGSDTLNVLLKCTKMSGMLKVTSTASVLGTGTQSGAATPELGSGELLATGLVPALGIVLYRRRRQRRASK